MDLSKCTNREKEIIKMIAEYGYFTYKDLSDVLYISQKTLRKHFRNIYKKLHIHSIPELIYNYYIEKIGDKV